MNATLRDSKTKELDVAISGNDIDGSDLVALSLAASVKIDRLYSATFGEEAATEKNDA